MSKVKIIYALPWREKGTLKRKSNTGHRYYVNASKISKGKFYKFTVYFW